MEVGQAGTWQKGGSFRVKKNTGESILRLWPVSEREKPKGKMTFLNYSEDWAGLTQLHSCTSANDWTVNQD